MTVLRVSLLSFFRSMATNAITNMPAAFGDLDATCLLTTGYYIFLTTPPPPAHCYVTFVGVVDFPGLACAAAATVCFIHVVCRTRAERRTLTTARFLLT